MKKLIFKFFYLLYFFSDLHANDIFFHYEKIKNQIKTNHLVESGDYFSGSFSKYSSIESIDIEKNRTEAINNFLDFLSDSIDWPKTLLILKKKNGCLIKVKK